MISRFDILRNEIHAARRRDGEAGAMRRLATLIEVATLARRRWRTAPAILLELAALRAAAEIIRNGQTPERREAIAWETGRVRGLLDAADLIDP